MCNKTGGSKQMLAMSICVAATLLFLSSACRTSPEHNASDGNPGNETLSLVDLELGPVTTYVEACERCHGPEGAFFSGEFQKQTPEEIHEINFEMMVGPGQLDPTEAEVDAMTDYMLAVRQKEPYLVVINGETFSKGETDTLQGEMRPGTTLLAEDSGSALETDGATWSLKSPQLPLTLKAKWKGKEHLFKVPSP